ncbi:MAG: pyridoxal-phosphate dependent enzyme, partial [Patescibacteria group bacterium]
LVSKEVTPAKLKLLQIAGAKVEIVNEPICPEPNNPDGAISIARKRGQEQGVVNLDQYSNSKNPAAHQELTARQVYDQLSGQVDYFVAGMGTTGTILGSAHFFREQDGNTQLIGVARKPNNYVPGIRTENLLAEVEFDWQDYVDEIFVVGTKDSFAWSLELIRHGLPAGPSAGFAYAGALEIANKYADDGQYVDAGPVNIVFICPDSPLPYLDDYFTYLPIENFKKMINEHLLDEDVTQNSSYTEIEEMNADELYEKLDDFYLLDVRSAKEFEDHHIEGSVNMTLDELVQHLPELKQIKKPVVVICKTGARSHQASLILSKLGVKSKTLEGGTSEWSSRGYQRITPDYCKRQP